MQYISNLKIFIGTVFRVTKNFVKKTFILVMELPGTLLEYKVNTSGNPIVFKDWLGNKFWQYPGDKIRLMHRRKSVTDSKNVINYIINNVPQGSICIDIGADIGSISVVFWSKVGSSGKVISVEADPRKIDKIKANLELNSYSQDYAINVAISEREEIRQLRCYPKSTGWNTFGNPSFAKNHSSFLIDVKTISFEQLAVMYKLESMDIVKIDTEGAELLILSGMRHFLENKKIAKVIFEVNYLMLEGMNSNVSELMSYWKDFDYELWRIADNGKLLEIKDSWPSNLVGDCIAISRT